MPDTFHMSSFRTYLTEAHTLNLVCNCILLVLTKRLIDLFKVTWLENYRGRFNPKSVQLQSLLRNSLYM